MTNGLASDPSGRRISVVLADDSPTIRSMLGTLLAEIPEFDLTGLAEDGTEAVSMVLELRPDVAIIDLQMPGLDGLGAARQILSQWPEAQIVLNTAEDAEELREAAASVGVADFVSKGASPMSLIQAVLELGRVK